MRNAHTLFAIVSLFFGLFGLNANAQNNNALKVKSLPRDVEIQLALSALPPHLRDKAAVYVLHPDKGFEIARKGTNGFHTFVARTGDDTFRGSWPFTAYRDDILYPISFDEAGAKANMRVFFDVAELQAKGTKPEELKKMIQERYKTHYYRAPERAGISYMLSPVLRTYVDPDKDDQVQTTNNPHIMHLAPNISNKDIGGSTPGINPYPFVILHGPHGYVVQHLGQAETAALTKVYGQMLARLCSIKDVWCLPKAVDQ